MTLIEELLAIESEAEALLSGLPPMAKMAAPNMVKSAEQLKARITALREAAEFEENLPF